MSTDRPKSPDAAWVASLKVGSEVVVIDPVPWHAVYVAKVKRITPTGRLVIVHQSGHDAGTFHPNGYATGRGSRFGYWPRFLISPETLASLGEVVR